MKKNCLPQKPLKVRKELQVYSAVPDCWLKGDAEAGVSQEVDPPLCGVLDRPPTALVMIGEICFIFFNILVG